MKTNEKMYKPNLYERLETAQEQYSLIFYASRVAYSDSCQVCYNIIFFIVFIFYTNLNTFYIFTYIVLFLKNITLFIYIIINITIIITDLLLLFFYNIISQLYITNKINIQLLCLI